MSERVDEWAVLDELLGVEVTPVPDEGLGPIAFYGRCSTEDNQDPKTSRGWQLGNARKFVAPLGATLVAEYFDTGQSRSVPWERRHEGQQLLAALKDPDRGWSALVVGRGRAAGSATSSRSSHRGSRPTASSCGCPSWAASSTTATRRTRC